MTVKMNGKVLYRMGYMVSGDGKTLSVSGATATNEKIKIVYDRQ